MVPGVVSGWTKPGSANTTVTHTGKVSSPGQAASVSEEAITPAEPTYEVQSGDTLAAIALRNYKRVSPRLLDEICLANNMKNANVLSLGQKIVLPVYHPQDRPQTQSDNNTTATAPAVAQ
jgi:LysM repeat protein